MNEPSIAIVVTWFGKLPSYFPAWLKSAEANRSIDFLIFSDCSVVSTSPNIKCFSMTLEKTLSMFETKLKRKISIHNSYKFCDCRAFFGITYADYLKNYEFWGYCDIDLVFGNIRRFLTPDILNRYDRFYQYGHLCLFRNCDKINHLYDLPGGIYTQEEIFQGKAKTTPEEHFGLNRICEKNHIRWYTKVDFVDFAIKYPDRLEAKHAVKNFKEQVFVWHQGKALRFYIENGIVKHDEFVYMHWQKRKPIVEGELTDDSFLLLTGNKLLVLPGTTDVQTLDFQQYNPVLSAVDHKRCQRDYMRKKIAEFFKADVATKKMWIRQKIYKFIDGKRTYL